MVKQITIAINAVVHSEIGNKMSIQTLNNVPSYHIGQMITILLFQ